MNETDLLNIRQSSPEAARRELSALLQERDRKMSLPQPLYNDPFMFRVDLEEVFYKEWLFAAMSCELPSAGDYVTLKIGQCPVVLIRDRDGQINAFHNVCRHRGSEICTKHRGKAANLVCPYHQWTYNYKGDLIYAGTEMGKEFSLNEHHLKPVHCRVSGGFVFVNLSQGEAPDISPFLETLETYMEPYDMENTKVAVESNIIEEANWKLVIENNRECYHCAGSHPELLNTLLEWDSTNDPRAPEDFLSYYRRMAAEWDAEKIPHQHVNYGGGNRIVRMPLKEGTDVMTLDGASGCNRLMGRIRNPQLGSMRILHLPNSWNHMQSDHAIVFRVLPISAQKTLVTTKWLVHKDATEGVDYQPSRLRLVWDATNDQDRILAEQNQRGINSFSYQPGPYSETYEYGVIEFLDWYSEKILGNLSQND